MPGRAAYVALSLVLFSKEPLPVDDLVHEHNRYCAFAHAQQPLTNRALQLHGNGAKFPRIVLRDEPGAKLGDLVRQLLGPILLSFEGM